ncbi:MAG: hypothetical protein WCB58_06130 [Acidobacteriaceae bacterium]
MQQSFASLAGGLDLKAYKDWLVFDQRLKTLVREGQARRVPASRRVYAYYEEWYLNEASGELYLYLPPDEKIRARWEPVDALAPEREEESHPSGLAAIPIRQMSSIQRDSLKQMLILLVANGVAMVVECPKAASIEGTETWYKDAKSQIAYRLVEKPDGSSVWERAPSNSKETAIQ